MPKTTCLTTAAKTFQVRFSVTDVYPLTVKAAHKPDAIRKAKAHYDRYGEDPGHGIHLELTDGGVHGWDAEEVAS